MLFSGLNSSQRGEDDAPASTDRDSTTPSSSAEGKPRRRRSFFPRRVKQMQDLRDDGLKVLRDRLGLSDASDSANAAAQSAPISVSDSSELARAIIYSHDIDGHAEAGEIVWLWVPVDGPSKPPAERAMLVIGQTRFQELLGLLISAEGDHGEDHNWLSIGPGQWNETGEQGWVRLDKVIKVPEHDVRRQGILLPERRFDRIARAMGKRFGWQ